MERLTSFKAQCNSGFLYIFLKFKWYEVDGYHLWYLSASALFCWDIRHFWHDFGHIQYTQFDCIHLCIHAQKRTLQSAFSCADAPTLHHTLWCYGACVAVLPESKSIRICRVCAFVIAVRVLHLPHQMCSVHTLTLRLVWGREGWG